MASTTHGKVLYRSKDALQNLRIKVSLTRVSAPRADRAAEIDEKWRQERARAGQAGGLGGIFGASTVSDQMAAAQAAAAAAATSLVQNAPARTDPADPSAETAPAPASPAFTVPSAAPAPAPDPAVADAGDDVSAASVAAASASMPSYQPQPGGRRARSSLQTPASGAPGGQMLPGAGAGAGGPAGSSVDGSSSADVPARSAFDPYGGGGAGAVTESNAGAEDIAAIHRVTEGPLHFERVVAWQEKIFSPSEVETRRRAASAETELDRKYNAMVAEGAPGEVIYTYVSADRFADERDAEKYVTTSPSEPFNGLFKAVFGAPGTRVLAKNAAGREATRLRTELARGRRRRSRVEPATFTICADCGPLQLPPDHPVFRGPGGMNAEREVVLMTVEAYPDGSIALSPDFTKEEDGEAHRVERRDGSVWEYAVVNASTRDETPLERRAADVAPVARLRELELTRRRRAGNFAHAPSGPSAARVVVLGEIVAGRGFEHDNLYCEWTLDYDPAVWSVEGSDVATSGVTQVSKTIAYPHTGDGEGDGAFSADRLVAHWALPFELSLVAREEPKPADWPCVYFQVSSYDAWDRYRCEGYGRLALGACAPGRNDVVVKTWRAGGSLLDRMKTHYVGGAPEIGDVTYVGVPRDEKGSKVHSRLGFVADASGDVKVRAHVMTQRPRQASSAAKKGFGKLRGLFASGGISGGDGDGDEDEDGDGAAGTAAGRRVAAEREVADVVARARARIAEARAQGRADPKAAPRAMLLARAPVPAPAPAPARGGVGEGLAARFAGMGMGTETGTENVDASNPVATTTTTTTAAAAKPASATGADAYDADAYGASFAQR